LIITAAIYMPVSQIYEPVMERKEDTMPGDITTSAQETLASASSMQEPSRVEHELYFSSFVLRLLVILCLGSVASFSLAPHFLPSTLNVGCGACHRPQTVYANGVCTALPQTIDYIQKPSAHEKTSVVPSEWTKAGKNSLQFALAQACVAAFTVTYETMSIAQPASLTSAVSMLSSTGKEHFFVGTATEPKDPRLSATWQAQARKEHLQQSAQALNKAQLQTVLVSNGTFSAIFIMNYQLRTTISGKSTTQQKHLIVILAALPRVPSGTSTGWQVFDWSSLQW